jgi:hypothetical protein
MKALSSLKVTSLVFLVLGAAVHMCACPTDLHKYEEPEPTERLRAVRTVRLTRTAVLGLSAIFAATCTIKMLCANSKRVMPMPYSRSW